MKPRRALSPSRRTPEPTSAGDVSVETLVAKKRARDLTVSVVLPALNEASTVAGVVRAVAGLHGILVDEIVVADSGSTDGTQDTAAAAGARVVDIGAVLPQFGPVLGKGDAMWRSLAVADGDLLVFLDADVRNPSPAFVSGLVAPLLLDPGTALVKAVYDRPLGNDHAELPEGGGRVTELLARPLLNLFWPELSGLVQPLSGECAATRSLLEQLPFLTGYGVELGLLLDTVTTRGAHAIAQVDLGVRVHRNQSLDALSRMAFAILHVAARRLRDEGRLGGTLPSGYLQHRRIEGRFESAVTDVEVVERPPLRTVQGRSGGPTRALG